MHTLFYRLNALATFAGTMLVLLCCLVSVTGAKWGGRNTAFLLSAID